MNILYIGPYKQSDEWGRKSRALLGALKKTGHLVTSRPIYFAPPSWSYTEEAEYSTAEEYDVLVQFTLPSFAVYNGRFKKNIGFFNTDTIDHSLTSSSISRMKLLDEIWVENSRIHEHLSPRVGDTKVSLVKPYMDIDLEQEVSTGRFAAEPIMRRGEFEDKFLFYFIGSLEEREGIEETFCAYLSEFGQDDQCALICVLERPTEAARAKDLVDSVTSRMGAIRIRGEQPLLHIINPDGPLPAEARFAIHREGDCFVRPDHSFNCSMLTLEAITSSSTPIINKRTSAYDMWGDEVLWGVDSYEESSLLRSRNFDDMFTSKEVCVKPVVLSLAENMRKAYTDKFLRDSKRDASVKVKKDIESDQYYESLKELLCS